MDCLKISNLSKTYSNGVEALQDISIDIPVGMFGLLGPNGAGKSTLMRILATLQEADKGEVWLDNLDVLIQKNEVRKVLGYLPQDFGLYPGISAEALLSHLAVLKGLTSSRQRKELVDALLYKTNLYGVRKQKLGGYSGGMKQRFGIAQALLTNPRVLIVDEPTAGLDPAERNRFHNLISELAAETIIILSTHIVEDVKELCTQMAIMNHGKVMLKGEPLNVINQLEGKVYQKIIRREELGDYKEGYRVIAEKLFLGKPIIHILSETDPGAGFTPMTADLEDVYFSQIYGGNQTRKVFA